LFESSYCSYAETGYFSQLIVDYLSGEKSLESFYEFSPDKEGIKKAIDKRVDFPVNRKLLVDELNLAYNGLPITDLVSQNIDALLKETTFTVCTAHQPNIFTGQLYFIYKIVHAIKLSEELNLQYADKHFVPVYFMGSEDADLNELGAIKIKGESLKWNTQQKGAVGRMLVDEELIALIDKLKCQCANDPYIEDIVTLLTKNYLPGQTINQSTLMLVNELFGKYGLVVFMPDNKHYKRECFTLFQNELLNGFSHKIIQDTINVFPGKYPIQTKGRAINLFYLHEDIRERIEKNENRFAVVNTDINFNEAQLIQELRDYPERFSPNVILRPLFQEICLPNIAFVGGGGELAYWLELKDVFKEANVFFPTLLLRNSFMLINKQTALSIKEIGISNSQLFLPEDQLAELFIRKLSVNTLDLNEQQIKLFELYEEMALMAASIDKTLKKHVLALQQKAGKRVGYLQKKMLKAEKRKYQDVLNKLKMIKDSLFPGEALQERNGNYFDFASSVGLDFLDVVYQHSASMDAKFCIVSEVGY